MTPALMEETKSEGNTESVAHTRSTFLPENQCGDCDKNMTPSFNITRSMKNSTSSESNDDQTEQRGFHSVRLPPRPPAPSAEAVKKNSIYGRTHTVTKPSEASAIDRPITLTASMSEESFSSISEDLDEMTTALMEETQLEVKEDSVPQLSDDNNNMADSPEITVTTKLSPTSSSNEEQTEDRGLHPVRPPPRPPAPSTEAVERNNFLRRTKLAMKTCKSNEDQTEQRGLHNGRPPPRPPAPSAEAVERNSFFGRSNSFPSVKASGASGTNRRMTLPSNHSEERFTSIYKDTHEIKSSKRIEDPTEQRELHPARPPPRPPAPSAEAVKRNNIHGRSNSTMKAAVMEEVQPVVKAQSVSHPSNGNNKLADLSETSKSNEDQTGDRGLHPISPPLRPPAPSAEAVERNSIYGRTIPCMKPSPPTSGKLCYRPSRPDRPLPPQRPHVSSIYSDRLRLEITPDHDNGTETSRQSRSSSTGSVEQSPDHSRVHEDALDFTEIYGANVMASPVFQQADFFDSSLECEPSPPQIRPPTPPSFNPPLLVPSDCSDSLYSEIDSPTYVEIFPDESEDMHITCLLRWMRKASKKDSMSPSQYGLSIDEEMRSFNQKAVDVTKALRLFNHLMIKRKDNLKNIISEFRLICGTLDKIQKKNKTMSIAGGTTGAVGGMTAVMGIALAPATIGASLVATLVGAGMVASAGAMGAHTVKANKKIVDRVTVERLLYDYKTNIVDLELCLHFILVGMNELRRHDIARLNRAGAEPDAVKMAYQSEAVYRNNTKNKRETSTPNTSEKLLIAFAKEMDQYFSAKDVTLRKSTKSKFSGRICLLAENLQDEVDYLNDMWGIFSS